MIELVVKPLLCCIKRGQQTLRFCMLFGHKTPKFKQQQQKQLFNKNRKKSTKIIIRMHRKIKGNGDNCCRNPSRSSAFF